MQHLQNSEKSNNYVCVEYSGKIQIEIEINMKAPILVKIIGILKTRC